MSTLVVYASDIGAVNSVYMSGLTWAQAYAGTGSALTNASTQVTAWYVGVYDVFESFLDFDTSALGGAEVTAVTLAIWPTTISSIGTENIEAIGHDFGSSVETGDYVAGSSIGTRLAYASHSIATGAYRDFTSESGFAAAIAASGTTSLMLYPAMMRTNTAPVDGVTETRVLADNPNQTNPPKLTITYTGGSPTSTGAVSIPATTVSGSGAIVPVLTSTGAAAFAAMTVTGAAAQTLTASGAITGSAVTMTASALAALVESVRPTDDITTTGWAETPLWSKIDDVTPDGVVITATAG